MSYLPDFLFTAVGTMSLYLGLGVLTIAAGWVADTVLAGGRKPD